MAGTDQCIVIVAILVCTNTISVVVSTCIGTRINYGSTPAGASIRQNHIIGRVRIAVITTTALGSWQIRIERSAVIIVANAVSVAVSASVGTWISYEAWWRWIYCYCSNTIINVVILEGKGP